MLPTLLIALALSMDAFSVASGVCVSKLSLAHALRASLSFGLFQFAMPVAGWLLGETFRAYIQGLDHWIAFGLLAIVGGRMVAEAIGRREPAACPDDEKGKTDIRDPKTLLVLSVATSIDALAVGLSYSVVGTPILEPAAVIGIVTFVVCLVGTEFGKRIGARFERWASLAGGLVLIGIGARILIEHLSEGI